MVIWDIAILEQHDVYMCVCNISPPERLDRFVWFFVRIKFLTQKFRIQHPAFLETRKIISTLKKPLHFREIQWGIYNTSSLKCNGFFQLIRVHHFRGVSGQTNTQTHWHPIALGDRWNNYPLTCKFLDFFLKSFHCDYCLHFFSNYFVGSKK